MRHCVGVLLPAVLLCSAVRADEADAVKLVEKLGGKITRDDKQPGKPVIEIDLSYNNLTDGGLKELKELKLLATLKLKGTGLDDAALKELKELKQLTTLDLSGTFVTDAGLKDLKELKQLTTLDLSGCEFVTDEGVGGLKALKQLTNLDLAVSKVTDGG